MSGRCSRHRCVPGPRGLYRTKGRAVIDDAALIQGIVVICRNCLDFMRLSSTTPDDDLRPGATLLFKRIKAGEPESALIQTVANMQLDLRLAPNVTAAAT